MSTEDTPLRSSITPSPGSRRSGRRKTSNVSASVLHVSLDADGDAMFRVEELDLEELEEAAGGGGIKGCLSCDCDTNDLHYKITLWILILLTLAAFAHAFYLEIGDLQNKKAGE